MVGWSCGRGGVNTIIIDISILVYCRYSSWRVCRRPRARVPVLIGVVSPERHVRFVYLSVRYISGHHVHLMLPNLVAWLATKGSLVLVVPVG